MSRLIKTAAYINGIDTLKELSGETGIPYQRMYKRMQDTDMFRVWELRAIAEAANLSDEDIVKLVRGNV